LTASVDQTRQALIADAAKFPLLRNMPFRPSSMTGVPSRKPAPCEARFSLDEGHINI
jgi:hypothetical protein